MSMREALHERKVTVQRAQAEVVPLPSPVVPDRNDYREMASEVHRLLLDVVDLGLMGSIPPDRLREELRVLIEGLISDSGMALNANERRQVVIDVQNEMMGYGPLESLLNDPTVSDILVNTYRTIYVERRGKLELSNVRFTNEKHLLRIVDKIVSNVGRRIDESSPMVDARLPDGSRVNAVIPPLAIDGASMSIRKFSSVPLRGDDLIRNQTLTPEMAELLAAMVKAELNILISGGTGSGKTTLLNMMSSNIDPAERLVTIEDAAELQLQQHHVVRLETRPPNIEGKGEVNQRALVRNALRMRPDRIIVGEIRGAEAYDMLQAMNTGHEGSMATIHANTPRDGLARMENMLGMAGMTIPQKAMRQQIVSAVSAIVQVARLSDGRRKITSITEITGMESDVISLQEIFEFQQSGVGPDGAVLGSFRATGIRPQFLSRLSARGIRLPENLFEADHGYGVPRDTAGRAAAKAR
jgi:pilus assembly protein CpaF